MATNTYTTIDCKEELYLINTNTRNYKGYKQSILINKLSELEIEFFVCTQCNGVMRNACQIGEDQICVCENCSNILTNEQPRQILNSRKKILELKVNCPLGTRGCKWYGTFSEVDTHLDVCEEFFVKCKYDCGVILKRRELNDHCNNECSDRIICCEYCQSVLVYKYLKRHFENCLEFSILCPNACGNSIKRKQMNSHIDTDCPNTTEKCPFERFGCKQVVKRCEMEEHKKTNETKHLEMTTFFAMDRIDRLEETNSKLFKVIDKLTEKINKLEEIISEKCAMDNKRESLEDIIVEREATNTKTITQMMSKIEKQSAIIESLSYHVVLRDTLSEIYLKKSRGSFYLNLPLARYDISWRFNNLSLLFGRENQETLHASILMNHDDVMFSQAESPFEGRFKLTIIDRINANNSLAYETPVVKLLPKQETNKSFTLVKHNSNESKIAIIPRYLLIEDRFKTENGGVAFTLQIQDT